MDPEPARDAVVTTNMDMAAEVEAAGKEKRLNIEGCVRITEDVCIVVGRHWRERMILALPHLVLYPHLPPPTRLAGGTRYHFPVQPTVSAASCTKINTFLLDASRTSN